MRRIVMIGSILGLLVGLGLAVPAQAGPGRSGETSAKQKCDGYYETRSREIPPGSGNSVPFTAYWVPMSYPGGDVEDLPVLNRAGCITTVLAGGNVEPVPYTALSTTAINAQCKYLEGTAIAGYPYRFYGNPNYEAKNRSGCIYFLRQFHLGNLPPGPG